MAADFHTSIQMNGTTEQILSMLQVFKSSNPGKDTFSFDYVTIKKTKRANSVQILLDNAEADELASFIAAAKNKIYLDAVGPCGQFGLLDEVPVFMCLAEAAPNAAFSGKISGFNPSGDQKMSGTLSEGSLVIKTLLPCEEDEFYDEEEFDECEDGNEEIQKFTYIDGKWAAASNDASSDEISIHVAVQMKNGEKYDAVLSSELEDNLRLTCLPERILAANTVPALLHLLTESLAADSENDAVIDENTEKLTGLEQSIAAGSDISSVTLTRTIRADDEFFSGLFAEDQKLVKLAKAVVKEKGSGASTENFLNYIKDDDISIPACDWMPEWPNFCGIGRIEDDASPDQGDWNFEVPARIDWGNAASDIAAFAELCAKRAVPDNSYAEETIHVDYVRQEYSQSAVFLAVPVK